MKFLGLVICYLVVSAFYASVRMKTMILIGVARAENHDDWVFWDSTAMNAQLRTLVILSVQLMIWIHLVRLIFFASTGSTSGRCNAYSWWLQLAPSFPWFYNLDSDICIDFSRS